MPGINFSDLPGIGAPGLRLDPFTSHNFIVELDGLIVGGFARVEGLEGSIEVEEYAEGGRNDAPHKLLKGTRWQNLVLSRGMMEVDSMWRWFAATARGEIRRRSGALIMLNAQRAPISGWIFHGAVPVRWVGPSFDAARDSEVAIERVELTHMGLERSDWFAGLGALARVTRLVQSGSDG